MATEQNQKNEMADAADGADGSLPNTQHRGIDMKAKTSQSARLVTLASGGEFFHTPENRAFATVTITNHKETHRLDSPTFRSWLGGRYYHRFQTPASPHALDSAIDMLKGRAQFDGKSHNVSVRLAQGHEAIYLDLGDEKWRVVRIDSKGWEVISNPPVKFRRPSGMQALPVPEDGGSVDDLRKFVNMSDDDWVLMVAWLVGAFRPTGPFPVLELQGEHGTAKSTTSEVIRSLVDPNTCPLRSAPRDERDLMIAATNGWVIAYDNLSYIRIQLSDALCRISTGGGFATRTLYTDQDEILLEAQRPVLLNGIEELVKRPDLLDRAVTLRLQPIPPDQRRLKHEFLAEFNEARPRILGALLSVVSQAMNRYSDVKLDTLPRMADFAQWSVAAESSLGWPEGRFLKVYEANRAEAQNRAVESSPVGALIVDLAEREEWSGTATELLSRLREDADTDEERQLPKNASTLSNMLNRITSNLRSFGVLVVRDRQGKGGRRMLHITKKTVSAVSPSAENPVTGGKTRTISEAEMARFELEAGS